MKHEVADREQRLDSSNQEYQGLQRQLRDMLTTIAKETNDIKKLEQELREGNSQNTIHYVLILYIFVTVDPFNSLSCQHQNV